MTIIVAAPTATPTATDTPQPTATPRPRPPPCRRPRLCRRPPIRRFRRRLPLCQRRQIHLSHPRQRIRRNRPPRLPPPTAASTATDTPQPALTDTPAPTATAAEEALPTDTPAAEAGGAEATATTAPAAEPRRRLREALPAEGGARPGELPVTGFALSGSLSRNMSAALAGLLLLALLALIERRKQRD
ncbi:MAG: hypothetical protein R2911_04165 [Caldilineaceae bacterium]